MFQVHMEIRWVEQKKNFDFVYILSDGYLFYRDDVWTNGKNLMSINLL